VDCDKETKIASSYHVFAVRRSPGHSCILARFLCMPRLEDSPGSSTASTRPDTRMSVTSKMRSGARDICLIHWDYASSRKGEEASTPGAQKMLSPSLAVHSGCGATDPVSRESIPCTLFKNPSVPNRRLPEKKTKNFRHRAEARLKAPETSCIVSSRPPPTSNAKRHRPHVVWYHVQQGW
jgi:hypothetical protein